MSDLPPGFVLDQPATAPPPVADTGLPPGFVLDGAGSAPIDAPPAQRGQWDNFKAGLSAIWEDPKKLAEVGPGRVVPSVASALTLPGDVATGKQPMGLPTQTEDLSRVADLMGLVSSAPIGGKIAAGFQAAENAAPRVVAPAAGEVIGAAGRLGVDVPRAVATDSRALQAAGAGLRNVPFAGEPLMQASEKTLQQLGGAADEVARGFSPASAAEAGGAAREALTVGWKGKTTANLDKLYGRVDELVKSDTVIPLEGTRGVIAKITADRAAQRINDPGKAASFVLDAVQDPAGLTYEGIKGLRTRVGEMLKDKNALATSGVSEQELKAVYGGLSDDLRGVVKAGGGDKALSAFETANGYAAAVAERQKRLQAVVGGASDESVLERLAAAASSKGRADIELLTKARRSVGGEAWDDVAGAVVSRLGRDVEGQFSPQRFLTDYSKLSAEGKAVLFNSTGKGDLARSLNDIATISSRFKDLQKYANPSGTGRQAGFTGFGAALATEPVMAITGVLGANVVSRILASPPSASSMAKWVAAYEKAATAPSPGSAALLERATRNLSATAGVPITVESIVQSLAGPDAGAGPLAR